MLGREEDNVEQTSRDQNECDRLQMSVDACATAKNKETDRKTKE
jgi:hypothetical protein